ncbi:MAG: thioredoxin domain-containing protein, partial [Gammaproteobacteria bacterium]|nr:thioredoxin domain-containing protein [Gammaproteobacteria bacterium]
ETSPYLLQHARNPVQWYPWGEEALQRAREEDKPILLSIGYSACHWCHVMAHESFEDASTAALMNKYFVNIKVDREERPDLDKIYQTAQQLLTQRTGGWPLTMFLTPEDHMPFFGGTYFPPESRYGMPGFRDLLERVAQYFRAERDAIRRQNDSMRDALGRLQESVDQHVDAKLDAGPLHDAVRELEAMFDRRYGGFGGAPKFPHATNLELLLSYHGSTAAKAEPARHGLEAARFTLERMALGGIYDQLAGGFSRYSVDDIWMIPHFEKMLYDNGPLLALYADAWHLSRDPLFRRIARETADWVMREMQDPAGGYYSSLDADSEGEEGRFYVWTRDEVQRLLTPEEYDLLSRRFGLDRDPNFEGCWHLHVFQAFEDIARATQRAPGEVQRMIDAARARLLAERSKRIRPGRDEKILTSWNALMIKGMAVAALRLGDETLIGSAERALAFIHGQLWQDHRLLATCKDGRAHLNAYLDDYAFLIDAILSVLSCRWSTPWLEFAMQLADALLRDFQHASGGFYFTSHAHEHLIQRRRDFMDDAVPSGNGVAAAALARLGHLLGDQRYLSAAEAVVQAAGDTVERVPHAHNALLLALLELLDPPQQVILRGPEAALADWRSRCADSLNIRTRLYAIPSDERRLPGLLAERRPVDGVTAYVCEGFQCSAPIHDVEELAAALKGAKPE